MFEHLLITQLYSFFLIFCRVGAGIMTLPGFGEAYVPARSRLLLALGVSLSLTPLLGRLLPPMPSDVMPLFLLIAGELLIGLFLGALARIMISCMHTAGHVIAYQVGLASAVTADVVQAGQSTILANLLGVSGLILLFATDTHHLMLRALHDSYDLFRPGQMVPTDDMANYAVYSLGRAFAVALQISSPLVVIGLILYLCGGILSRLMPTLQIFFIMMPVQIYLTLFILMVTIGASFVVYTQYIEERFEHMLAPPEN